MGRKVFKPITQKFGEREIYRDQEKFGSALVNDPPASDIPDDALAKLSNAIAYPEWVQGRNGSKLYSSVTYPALSGRTSYNLTFVGTTVTSNSGDIFTEDDVSQYIVANGIHYEIVAYISATQVTVDVSANGTWAACKLRGRVNARFWHKVQRKAVTMLGADVYVQDYTLGTFTKILCISATALNNVNSAIDELDDHVIIWNSAGIFKVILDVTNPYMYCINTLVPNISINTNEQKDNLTIGRRYLYSMMRLRGSGIRDRTDGASGALIEQESGTNGIRDDGYDYGEVWTEKARGDDTKTHGIIRGGNVAVADLDAGAVWAAITDGTLILSVNGNAKQIYVDFTGVETMADVAERIQVSGNVYYPDITVEFELSGIVGRFVITSGKKDNTTLGWVTDGVGGTNIADNMLVRDGDGGTLVTAEVYEEPYIVGDLTVPVVRSDESSYQQHWSHYSIYGTLDIGVAGTDPVTGIGNNPERFMWLYDLRVAAGFYASKDTTGLITASEGTFELADVGSIFEWENGDRDRIVTFVSSSQVIVDASGDVGYEEALIEQAAAIGNGDVFRASQTGYVVTNETVLNGNVFVAGDVGKTLFWADGVEALITEFIDANNVRVQESRTHSTQGMTKDYVYRRFNDTVSDDILRIRRNSGKYLLRQRFWEALPLSNIGVVVPGFLFAAVRGEKKIWYSQLPPTQKYLAGSHNPFHQVDESAKDGITYLMEFKDRLVAFCVGSTWAGATNQSIELNVADKVGEKVVVFGGMQVVDGNIGMLDYGSVQSPEYGVVIMITSEPAVRMFDGFKYGPNLAELETLGMDTVMKQLRSWQAATASVYHPATGYIVWGRP